MTRRRFAHCKNEKCNRRLEELLERPGESAPPDRFCEACLAMTDAPHERGFEAGYASGRRAGLWWGIAAGATLAIVAWIVDRCAAWIVAR